MQLFICYSVSGYAYAHVCCTFHFGCLTGYCTFVVHNERRNPVDFVSKVKVSSDLLSLNSCGQDADYNFAKSFSIFIRGLFMIRGGFLLIWNHSVEGTGGLEPSYYEIVEGGYNQTSQPL